MEIGEIENYKILDCIDFTEWIDNFKCKEVYQMMDAMEDAYNKTVIDNEYLQGCLFNYINEQELIDYLKNKYPNKFRIRESIKYYIV